MAGVDHKGASGSFTLNWDGVDLGYTEDGWALETTHKNEIVTFEEFGDSEIDLINRGATLRLDVVLKELNRTNIARVLWPWEDNYGAATCWGNFAIGAATDANSKAKALTCTPRTCTATGNFTWTFPKTIIEPDFASAIRFNNKLRMVPLRFIILLDNVHASSGVDYRYFTQA